MCVCACVCMCVYKSVLDSGENIVGSCSPNMPQISRGKLPKLLLYTQRFDQCGLLQVFDQCTTLVETLCIY